MICAEGEKFPGWLFSPPHRKSIPSFICSHLLKSGLWWNEKGKLRNGLHPFNFLRLQLGETRNCWIYHLGHRKGIPSLKLHILPIYGYIFRLYYIISTAQDDVNVKLQPLHFCKKKSLQVLLIGLRTTFPRPVRPAGSCWGSTIKY